MKQKCFGTYKMYVRILGCIFCIQSLAAQPDQGHFQFGLISLEISDSLTANAMMKDMLVSMFTEKSKYDLYFNPQKSVTVVQMDGSTKRIVYDDTTLLSYTFLDKGKEKYYSIDSSVWLLKAGHDEWEANGEKSEDETQRAMDSLSQLIKISREPGDMKAIFGFPCVKGVIMNPTELDRVFSVVYMTDKIPIPQEGFGELAVFFPGCPLESSILVQGYEMKVGALSFEPGIEDQNVFSVKTKKYKKVSSDELDVIMNNE